MLPKAAYVRVCDSSGAGWVQVFHVYRGSLHKYATLGDFVKGAVKEVAFYPRRRRGKRYRPLRLGFVVRGLVVQTRSAVRYVDGTRLYLFQNGVALLRRRGLLKTKDNPGLLVRMIRRRRYRAIFSRYI